MHPQLKLWSQNVTNYNLDPTALTLSSKTYNIVMHGSVSMKSVSCTSTPHVVHTGQY